MKKVRIGLIGVGGICNGVHIPGYLKCEECEIVAICDINENALEKTGERLQIPKEHRFTDYKELLNSGLVDAVDIATSNDVHVEIAMAALEAGLPVSLEKPLGMNADESMTLMKKSKETGIPVFVCFSWRYNKFPRYMKYLIEQGEIGEIYHIYVKVMKNSGLWKGRRLEWRFDEEKASSGVLCDLGSHMFDAIRFFGQEIQDVYCDRGIIIKERQKLDSDEWAPVTTDDWANVVCHLESGIGATVTVTRTATTENETNEFYVIGSKGALRFLSQKGTQGLYICAGDNVAKNDFVQIEIPEEFQSDGQSRSFVDLLLGKPDGYASTIIDGIKSQLAIDAAKLSSQLGRKVEIEEIYK